MVSLFVVGVFLTVVVGVLPTFVVDAARIVVVVARAVIVVEPETLAPEPLGQPPIGAGIMSSPWSPWPLRLLASTVRVRYGLVAELVAWQIVTRRVETVVVGVLDGAVVDAARIVVVVVARTVVVVEPETLALVRLGQPPAGAGIMSPLCPP